VYGGDTLITSAQNFAIWRAIGELATDSSIGWKFMSEVETDQYHPTLMAALHARTYRESIERLARYKQLCGAEEFKISSSDDEVAVEVSWPLLRGEPVPELLIDAVFALVLELGRRGTKTGIHPKRVELTRRPNAGSQLEEYFGCRIKHRAPKDVLVLRAADVDRPFATHNEELLAMLAPQFEQALEDGRSKQGILDQVKWVLKRLLAGSRPDLLMVAKELGIGERTLQRRITDEGTSFRQILNETRRELVHEYLGDPSVEINEAAFLVGYEDPNSFYRAFRSWEGKTPAEWRAEHHGKRA
jgi:AraC-like DNA-binding protein